jgi:ParB-like chromosome segregation protein Spo0J
MAYVCSDPGAALVPIAKLNGSPDRKLNRDDLARILRGFRDSDAIPPVQVYHDAQVDLFDLIHGQHRWRASLAYGFTRIPCLMLSLDEALEAGYKPR